MERANCDLPCRKHEVDNCFLIWLLHYEDGQTALLLKFLSVISNCHGDGDGDGDD